MLLDTEGLESFFGLRRLKPERQNFISHWARLLLEFIEFNGTINAKTLKRNCATK